MVRDSSKLLCRIIEEFENTAKRSRGDTDFNPNRRGLSTPVILPGLTDRKEWPDATVKVFNYGDELNKGFQRVDFMDDSSNLNTNKGNENDGSGGVSTGERTETQTMMVTISGEGSPVEEFIKTMRLDGKTIPTRIMLTGMSSLLLFVSMFIFVYILVFIFIFIFVFILIFLFSIMFIAAIFCSFFPLFFGSNSILIIL